jgi:hypothetical protein
MNEHCSMEELSAYTDGESRYPERTADHLRLCADCARRHRELLSLSTHVSALPGAETGPEFLTRVVARASELHDGPRPWWAWAGLRPAAACGLAAAILIGFFLYQSAGPANPPVSSQAALRKPEPEPAVETQIEPEDLEVAEVSDDPTGLEYGDEVSTDDMIAGLLEIEWFVVLASAWNDDDDLDAMLESMDKDETETFEDLLREYAKEGQKT